MKHLRRYASLYCVVISLVILFIYKWADFHLPYFWDELGVYGHGAVAMAQNGIGFLPSSLEPELSRGHPLLFYTLLAIVVKYAHFNVFIVHLFAFGVFVLLIISIFYTLQKLYDNTTAAIVCLLFMIQPVVIAQSCLVLPEVMLTLFSWWAIYYFISKNYLGYICMASLALMVKETAVTVPMALSAGYIVVCLFKKGSFRWRTFSTVPLPLLILVLFFIIQKIQNGWYIFPYHQDILVSNWNDFYKGVLSFRGFTFFAQNRDIYVYIMSAGMLMFLYKRFIVKHKMGISSAIIYAISFCSIFFLFCSINAINMRYILPMLPWILFLTALSLKEIFYKKPHWAILVCVPCIAWQWHEINPGYFYMDANEGYRAVTHCELKAAEYVSAAHIDAQDISTSFPMNMVLSSEHEGYPAQINSRVDNSNARYFITENCGVSPQIPDSVKTDTIARFKEGISVIYILKKR